ncbi:MAG TPA: Uma2 family endonuclease [Gemmatimonadaceae bacterium]|jgi:Uma2 family endonuclease
MAMVAANTEWTVDMLDELPEDGNRYELFDGELVVTPAPTDVHQLIAGELYARLQSYLRSFTVGRALVSPADVRREDRKRNRVQPDVFVVKLTDGKRPAYPYDLGELLLAVEVVSPSSARTDYQRKRDLYVGAGVEYWVIDAEAHTIAVWRNGVTSGALFTETLTWQAGGMETSIVIDLHEFFTTALS